MVRHYILYSAPLNGAPLYIQSTTVKKAATPRTPRSMFCLPFGLRGSSKFHHLGLPTRSARLFQFPRLKRALTLNGGSGEATSLRNAELFFVK